MKCTVISDGGWGTAMALVLLGNGHDVTIWGLFPDYIETMKKTRENSRFLKGVTLPEALHLTADLDEAVAEAELIVLATPSQFMRGSLEKMRDSLERTNRLQDRGLIFADLAKGIEVGTLKRMSEIVEEIIGDVRYVAISGPSHAEEVARGIPTAVTAASTDEAAALAVQEAFTNDFLRVYTSGDVIGAELGGALKNVFAIAAGIIDGMGLGDNSKAALMTRGIVEMSRLGVALGGEEGTFSGLSGLGDLIVTCTSGHSRNRHVGEQLGKNRKLAEIQADMGMVVAEGVRTAESASQLAKQLNVDTPIVNEVYACLYEDKSPQQAIKELMARPLKAE